MLSLMTFGAGFLMRPSALSSSARTPITTAAARDLYPDSDPYGRLAFFRLPALRVRHDRMLAPLLCLIGRLLQGFSAGMELGGVSVYLSEIATPGHKGFYVSWQSGSQQVAVMFAAFVGVVLSSKLPPEKMAAWGCASLFS